jgi:hypothetical protein
MLDLRIHLPVIRAAYEAGELPQEARYAAPCAVGLCLPEDTRVLLDAEDYHIAFALNKGVVNCPSDQVIDWGKLQIQHDVWNKKEFEKLLTELEKKYGQP